MNRVVRTIGQSTVSRRSLLGVASAGIGATLLGACTPSGGQTSPTATPGATEGTGGTGASEAQNFSFASWSLSEEVPSTIIQANMDTFAQNAGVEIAPVSLPYNEYLNQLTLQVRGGQFSGAAQLDIAWLGTLAALGRLRDVSALTQGRGYTQAALESSQFDGVQYGLPWTSAAIGMVANAEILEQVGASTVPDTIEDFEDLLRELQGLGVIPYAASTKVAQLKDVQVWMETFGSPLISDGRISVDDDGAVEALTWYKRLYDEGLISADVDRFDARSLMAQGRAAIYDDAPAGRPAVLNDSPDPDLAGKLLPVARPVVATGDTPRALAWGHTIVVVDGDGADTAGEFAQWLTSDDDVVIDYFEQLGLPPTTEAGLNSDAMAADEFMTQFSERITATATPSPFWIYPQYGQIDSTLAEYVQAILIGRQSPAEGLAEAQQAAQALID